MALAATRARLLAMAAGVVAEAAPATAPVVQELSAKAARAVRGEVNMPSRAIAAVLLLSETPVPNKVLYGAAKEYGNIEHHRHFKHVLRMMKGQNRVRVIAGPPEKVGGKKVTYCTQLTRRGRMIYGRYLGENVPLPRAQQ